MAVALTWNTVTLASGYYGNPQTAVDGSASNPFARLRGQITGPSNPNTVVFTIGAGSRPSAQTILEVRCNHRYSQGLLTINTDGTSTLTLSGMNTGSESVTYFLDGAQWAAEA